jgi:hypothetical protein
MPLRETVGRDCGEVLGLMEAKGFWTSGGDFLVIDTADNDAILAQVILHEPLKSAAVHSAEDVVRTVIGSLAHAPHPLADLAAIQRGEIDT